MNADIFAREEYRDYAIYKALAARERVPEFRSVLEELVKHEEGDFQFWRSLSKQKEFSVGAFTTLWYVFVRKFLGLTFTAKLLEGREKRTGKKYVAYLETVTDKDLKAKVEAIIEHERYHEAKLIGEVEEHRLKFVSSVVLGLNDGLIELTGALVGFSFALKDNNLVALAGVITGISASLSMASSAYMQAQYEVGKNPVQAGLVTGLSYTVVVAMLVAPFFIVHTILGSVLLMALFVCVILSCVSFYSSVLLERPFLRQFGKMFVFSVGVAAVAFLIGFLFKEITGISAV